MVTRIVAGWAVWFLVIACEAQTVRSAVPHAADLLEKVATEMETVANAMASVADVPTATAANTKIAAASQQISALVEQFEKAGAAAQFEANPKGLKPAELPRLNEAWKQLERILAARKSFDREPSDCERGRTTRPSRFN